MPTKSDSQQGVTLEATLNSSPGNIEISGTVTGKLGAGAGDLAGNVNDDTIDIRFEFVAGGDLTSEINSHFSDIRSQLSRVPSSVPASFRTAMPSDLNNIASESAQLWVGVFGQKIAGEEEVNFSKSVDFQPIQIPAFASNSINLDRLPSPKIRVKVVPREAIQRFVGGITNNHPSVEFEIPTDAIFEEAELDGFGCAELFDDIDTEIDRLKTRKDEAEGGLERESEIIEDVYDQISGYEASDSGADRSNIPDSVPASQRKRYSNDVAQSSEPQSIMDKLVDNFGRGTLQEWKTKVENTSPGSYNIGRIQSQVDSLKSEVNGIDSDQCASQFEGTLDDIDGTASSLASMQERAESRREEILDILTSIDSVNCQQVYGDVEDAISDLEDQANIGSFGSSLAEQLDNDALNSLISDVESAKQELRNEVDSGSPCEAQFMSRLDTIESKAKGIDIGDVEMGAPQLTCADVPRRLRNAVSAFTSAAQTFASLDIIARREDRKEEIISEGENVISEIESRVENDNPCKTQLISRAESALSEVKGAGTRPKSAIPCEDRFPDVSQKLEEFEDQALDLSPPVSPQDVQDIAQKGEEVISTVENEVPSDDSCRQEMVSRSRSLVERVEKLTTQTRISEFDGEEFNQQRQETMDRLFGAVDRVTPGDAELENPSDMLEDEINMDDIPDV